MGSTKVQLDLTIAAPPEQVFDFLCNLDKHPLWNAGLLSVSEHGQMCEGQTYHTTSQLMGRELKATNRVAELKHNECLKLVNQAGPLTYTVEFKLSPELSDVTKLACKCEIKGVVTFFELAAPLLEYLAQQKLKSDLETLKALVEHHQRGQ